MVNVIQLTAGSIASRPWKKRPGFDRNRVVEPGDYGFQAGNLNACFSRFKNQSELVREGINRYLEIQLFPEPQELKEDYFRYLGEQYALTLKKIESAGMHSRAHFQIENLDLLLRNLEQVIREFEGYSQEQIAATDFTAGRIKLWRYFQLSTSQTKNRVEPVEDFDALRLKVDFIESAPDFSSVVSAAAISSGIDATLYPNGIISIKQIRENGARRVADFAERLSQYDKIHFIKLDDFVSTIESPLQGGRLEEREYVIQRIAPDAPVVAVIDTGVQSHILTNSFLTDDGLDYRSGVSDPRIAAPFVDNVGHGTAVAAEIAYGKSIEEYLIAKNEEYLIPLVKIFPVRIADTTKNFTVPYDKIFDINGHFAEAVRRYNIKLVNISFASTQQKSFEEEKISEAANLMDRFAKELGVTFIVCVGNIDFGKLESLIAADSSFLFFQRPNGYGEPTANPLFKCINIGAPSDLLSGVVVGSCYPQKSKFVVSTFNRSYSFDSVRNGYSKPDVLAIGGGDAPVDLESLPARVCNSSQRVSVLSQHESFLAQQIGTSFSTPRVTRALAIAIIKYPDISPETLKCLFLHKASNYMAPDKKYGMNFGTVNLQRRSIEFADIYKGFGSLTEVNESDFFEDSEDEISFIIEGAVPAEKMISYRVPLAAMLGDGTTARTNKMELKLSICTLPRSTRTGEVSLKSANPFHVAAFMHVNSLVPTRTMIFAGRQYRDQCIRSNTPGIILGWTSDYQVRHFPTFSIQSKMYRKDKLAALLGSGDSATITVRGLSESAAQTTAKFAIVFSVKDLGATGEIRNRIRINV